MKYYNENGQLHREDGPAIEDSNGDKAWYFNGELHREDGPAIEYSDGDKLWYFNGEKYYTKEEYKAKIERIRKIKFKYFKKWELICEQPGKNLFNIRMNRAMNNIEELCN